jgi:hypothetical protein
MSAERLTEGAAKSSAAAWAQVVAAFGAASLVQIIACGAAQSAGGSGTITVMTSPWVSGLYDLVIALVWFFGPASIATWYSARKLRFWKDAGTARMTLPRSLSMLVLPALSIYLGIFVSFNSWGT